jgi:hypothetical protein
VLDPDTIMGRITALAQNISECLHRSADIARGEWWLRIAGVPCVIAVLDTDTVVPLVGSPLYPWRMAGVPTPRPTFLSWDWVDAQRLVSSLTPNGRVVRELLGSLSNFDDEGGSVPSSWMPIATSRDLNTWRATMHVESMDAVAVGIPLWLCLVLERTVSHGTPPPPSPQPPPPPSRRTPPIGGTRWVS